MSETRPALIKRLIWDWNGTLLNDVDLCVELLNELLVERGMREVTRDYYRARFGFPVREFYVETGFDFDREDFYQLSETFIKRYRVNIDRLELQHGALTVLEAVRTARVPQSVVSAMEEELLGRMLDHFRIRPYFGRIKGLGDVGATSKIQLGVSLCRKLHLAPEEILLIGDTLHDLETAKAIGCRCVLFEGGHQNGSRLAASEAKLINSLKS